MPRRTFLFGALLFGQGFSRYTDQDSVGMVQTKIVAREDRGEIEEEEDDSQESLGASASAGAPEATVITVLSTVTANGFCVDCTPTGFGIMVARRPIIFMYQPWRSTATLSNAAGQTKSYPLSWTPAPGVQHNQTVVLRSNDVHTYILTDGSNPAYSFRADWYEFGLYPETDSQKDYMTIFTAREQKDIKPGQTKCYPTNSQSSERHCLSVPAGEKLYAAYPLPQPYVKNQDDYPVMCRAWGDPHYINYGLKKYNFMGLGTYVLSSIGQGDYKHMVQAYHCPTKTNAGLADSVALATRMDGKIVTFIAGVTKIDGVEVKTGMAYRGNLRLKRGELNNGVKTLEVHGPVMADGSFVSVRANRRTVGRSILGYSLDTIVQLPAAMASAASGLCVNTSVSCLGAGSADVLFTAQELAWLDGQCCPPSGCTCGTPSTPPPGLPEVCGACTPAITPAAALSACSDDQDCAMDYCAACGNLTMPDTKPPVLAPELPPPPLQSRAPPTIPSGRGDPHCTNARGEAFNIHATGTLDFLKVPRLEEAGRDLRVKALIVPVTKGKCAPTVIKQLEFTGAWMGDVAEPLVIMAGDDGNPHLPVAWEEFMLGSQRGANVSLVNTQHHGINVVVLRVHGMKFYVNSKLGEKMGVAFLDLKIRNVESLGEDAGGLLGLDSHDLEAQPAPGCSDHEIVQLLQVDQWTTEKAPRAGLMSWALVE